MVELNLDNALNIKLILRQGDNYDTVFTVKNNGIDYDWDGVEDIIIEAKTSKTSNTNVLLLKKSTNDIEIQTGLMIVHLPPSKTDIVAGEYGSLECVIIYENDKPKTWWDGKLIVLNRGVSL